MLEVEKHRLQQAREAPVEDYDGRRSRVMDLHRRRSVLVRMTEDGRRFGTVRITNSPGELHPAAGRAGKYARVVVEATDALVLKAADTLAAAGAEVHLAHPLGVKAFSYRRVRTTRADAGDLSDLLRMVSLRGEDRAAEVAGVLPGPHAVPAASWWAAGQPQGSGPCDAGQARRAGDLLAISAGRPGRRGVDGLVPDPSLRRARTSCGRWPSAHHRDHAWSARCSRTCWRVTRGYRVIQRR